MPYEFKFYENDDGGAAPRFRCTLKKKRCTHVNPQTHKRCGREEIIGVELCWQHLRLDRNLRIRPSELGPHAGLGLFADNGTDNNEIVFHTRDQIIEYGGELIDGDQKNARYGARTAPYAVEQHNQLHTNQDGACLRSVGSTANHKPRNANLKRNEANARLVDSVPVRLDAVKNIRNGSEIFISSGSRYVLNDQHSHHTTLKVRSRSRYQSR